MPAAIPAIAAAFVTAGTATASAIGLSAATAAAFGAAAGNAVLALGFASGIGAGISAWATVASVGSAISTLSMKQPKPASSGVQLDTKYDPNAPRTVAFGRTAVGGTQLYMGVSGEKNVRLSRVFGLSIGPIHSIESFSAADYGLTWNHDPTHTLAECVATTAGAGSKLFVQNFRQGHHLGDPSNPIPPQTMTGTFMPELTSNSQYRGIAYAVQHLDYHPRDSFPAGDPKSGGFKWIGKWKTFYDPRKDTTYPGGLGDQRWDDPSSHEWTECPFIIGLNHALGIWQNGKKLAGLGARIRSIDVGSFLAAANISDSRGWSCGGEFTTSDDPYSVLTTILQAGSGAPINSGGTLSCLIDAPKASVFTLNQSDITGAIQITNSTAWRDRKNSIKPFSRSEEHDWEIIQGQTVSSPNYVDEDGGEVRSVEVSYPYVQNFTQAHQLAALELVASREFLEFSVTCKPHLLKAAKVGDCITVNLPDVAAPSQKCIVVARSFDPQTWQVTLTLKAETDGKHAWALGQSQEAPPSPSLSGSYNGFDPDGPLDADGFPSWTIIGNKVERDGVVMPAIIVAGRVADLTNTADIIVDYREFGTDDDAWVNHNTAVASTTRFEIVGLKPAQSYYVSVRYRTVLGVYTPRLILGPHTTSDLKIDSTKIDFFDALGEASIAAWGAAINETVEAANEATALVATAIADVNLLGETAIEGTLRDLAIKDRFDALTHVEGVDVATAITFEKTERITADEAFAETFALIGAKNANSTAFIIDQDTVRVTPTESLAQRFDAIVVEAGEVADAKILEERVAWTSNVAAIANSTILLNARVDDAEAAITTESVARVDADTSFASTLALLGAKNANSTAFVLDNSKVEIGGGITLASRLTSLQSATDTNSASITSLANTVSTNASSTATSISTLTATTGSHTSSISTLQTASTQYGARWGVTLNSNGHISGLLMNNNGASKSNITLVADSVVIASTSGGVTKVPFAVEGTSVVMDNVIARNIGANTITANQVVANNLTQTTQFINNGSTTLSGSLQEMVSGSLYVEGRVDVDCIFNFSQSSGSEAGAVVLIYRDGVLLDEVGTICKGAWGSNGVFGRVTDYPGNGSHTYSAYAYTSGGSSGNPTKTRARLIVNQKKSET